MNKQQLNGRLLSDYYKKILKLHDFMLPILKAGWSEDEVYKLLVFMEKNPNKIKNKKINEIVDMYKKDLGKKIKKEKF